MDIVEKSLKKVAKGALIFFIGTFLGMIFTFFSRIIIVRNMTPEQFGILSLVLSVINIAVLLAGPGMRAGIARFIARYKAEKNSEKVLGTITSATEIMFVTGILFFLVVFCGAGYIAKIFGNEAVTLPLRIYAFAIPALLLRRVFFSVFRGFGKAWVKVFFEEILRNIFFLACLGVLAFIGFSVINVIYVYTITAIVIFFLFAAYLWKKIRDLVRNHKPMPVRKELILFSLPLIAKGILSGLVSKTDVLMLGYFKAESAVGVYNASLELAHYIPIVLDSVVFLYLPLAAGLIAANQLTALNRSYKAITKWVFAVTFPIFLILFLFPGTVLGFLYGDKYVAGSAVLQIAAIALLFFNFLGPNSSTLIAIGKPKFLLVTTIASLIVNVLLNLILIPMIGIIGAAIATAVALIIAQILQSWKLYAATGIHPLTRNYMKPMFLSVLIVALFFIGINQVLTVVWWMLPIFFVLFAVIYLISLVLTRSVDKEDIVLLLALEKKSGLNLRFAKKIIKRFIL